ncbi:GxxExxY protein [Candidatus Shapirobacteria bacterium]|nr:GxxExxY protein [Candidatus Shapirobacteria bacterium]
MKTETHGTASQTKLLYPKLSYQIRGAIFTVYKTLGPYHKESIYVKALAAEFKERGISFCQEASINIIYQGKKVGVYRPDFLIDDKIIIEAKAVEFLPRNDERQLSYYLGGTSYRVGFLVNFGARNGVDIRRRIVGYDK